MVQETRTFHEIRRPYNSNITQNHREEPIPSNQRDNMHNTMQCTTHQSDKVLEYETAYYQHCTILQTGQTLTRHHQDNAANCAVQKNLQAVWLLIRCVNPGQ